MTSVLIDTGPLVAAINRRDQWHEWSRQQLGCSPAPVLTCESVLSEAWFLLRAAGVGRRSLLELMDRGAIQVAFDLAREHPRIVELLRQYEDFPMALADACLVRMSELIANSVVLTLDGDFRVYRRHRRQKIPLLIPSEL